VTVRAGLLRAHGNATIGSFTRVLRLVACGEAEHVRVAIEGARDDAVRLGCPVELQTPGPHAAAGRKHFQGEREKNPLIERGSQGDTHDADDRRLQASCAST